MRIRQRKRKKIKIVRRLLRMKMRGQMTMTESKIKKMSRRLRRKTLFRKI